MDPYVPLMALAYLMLQFSAMTWAQRPWRRFARLPIWGFGVGMVCLLVFNSIGAPLAGLLMAVSLPCATAYLALLWVLFLTIGPRRIDATI
jgi:hypothetical protein